MRAAPGRIDALERRIAELEKGRAVVPDGPPCPVCRRGALRTIKVERDPTFGALGTQQHTLRCSDAACGHSETRQVDH